MNIKKYKKENLDFISIDNCKIKVTFCSLGASIYSIVFNNKYMTMTTKNVNDFLKPDIYHGKTIGRTANRVKGSNVTIDGIDYKIENNEGVNTLHGGKNGLSTKLFSYNIKDSITQSKIEFTYISKENESGFPGNLFTKITYIIKENCSKLFLKFEAKTDKPTLCNLTNHAFFTLGEKSLDKLHLKIKGSRILKCGVDDLLPLQIRNIDNDLDFNKYKIITKDIANLHFGKANGYDHCYYLDRKKNQPVVFLKSKNVLLKIKTDFNCCQIYTDNWPDNSIDWVDLGKGTNRSIAIEPQDDFLNREILRPNCIYKRKICYEFEKI